MKAGLRWRVAGSLNDQTPHPQQQQQQLRHHQLLALHLDPTSHCIITASAAVAHINVFYRRKFNQMLCNSLQ